MKPPIVLFLIFCLALPPGCAIFSSRGITPIEWPTEITHMTAISEVSISWNKTRYSGDMSMKFDYPDSLSLEVYSPFGDTVLAIRKTPDTFLLMTGTETVADERRFADLFRIRLSEFMDDLAMKGVKGSGINGDITVQKENYRVVYSLTNGKNKMCWLSSDGTMCIHYLQVSFHKE